MANFTPWASLAGGMLIGVSASLMLLFNGKIAGISEIVAGVLAPARGDALWRLAFIVGLIARGRCARRRDTVGLRNRNRPLHR